MKKYRIRKKFPILTYAGSLIQQNHGENLNGHGFVLWDLETKKFKHYEIENEYGYFTVNLDSGEITSDLTKIPKKVRLRIKHKNCNPSDLKKCVHTISELSEIIETSYIREESDYKNDNFSNEINIHDIADVEYQNKLIEGQLITTNFSYDDINKIKDINVELNKKISDDISVKNIRWKPISFEFENMFSYGENNFIDFEKLNNIVGLFAKNADGKSSIFDSLSFCIFDKFSRGYKATNVLNIRKNKFKCKFHFKIDNVSFYIERTGIADKNRNVKVNVEFWKVENNKKIILNGEARRNTNDIIREYLGTYEDFILTVLSVQNSKFGSFVDMGQSERKDLICQFMGLNIFDKLYVMANEIYKEKNTLLKISNKDELKNRIQNLKDDLKSLLKYKTELESDIEILDSEKRELSDRIFELSEKTTSTNQNILDIQVTEKRKIDIENRLSLANKSCGELKLKLHEITLKINNLPSIKGEDILRVKCVELEPVVKEYNSKKSEIEKLKVIVNNKIEILNNLEKHEYDPNCNYCINNVFVKDAIKTKKSLIEDKTLADKLLSEFKTIKQNLEVYEQYKKEYEELIENKNILYDLNEKKFTIENAILTSKNSISDYESNLKEINDLIKTYYKNIDSTIKNKKLLNEISKLKSDVLEVEKNIKYKNSELSNTNIKLSKNEGILETISSEYVKINELELDFLLYKEYVSLVSRDGIPLKIINSILPELENEVNSILHEIVNFKVSINTDGKNIYTEICYSDEKSWPLEMGSGMEKFLSGLAIRVSLIHISNLPRPNIICIDEGWGSLDSENISSVESLFNILKTKFDFVWVISHLESMRDMVDSHIEITKIDNFSNVNNK
jgi:DNA repair exonuclease SbcCD ATPase subunit